MKVEYRIVWYREGLSRKTRTVSHLQTARKLVGWLTNDDNLHWLCDHEEGRDQCLPPLIKPPIIQIRGVGKWSEFQG